jgi:hypothetical protein
MRHKLNRRGSALIEFTLVGIPLMFLLISVFEISRAMWLYHTLAYSVKEGVRFAVVHGEGCDPARGIGNCQVTVADIANRIRIAGPGLLPNELTVIISNQDAGTAPGGAVYSSVTCQPLSSCFSNTDAWPTSPGNLRGNDIVFSASYPLRTALAMFWPGAGAANGPGILQLPASSRERIQF